MLHQGFDPRQHLLHTVEKPLVQRACVGVLTLPLPHLAHHSTLALVHQVLNRLYVSLERGTAVPELLASFFVGAIERGDVDAVRACYHPDARIWHNNDGLEQTVDENLRVLGWMARTLLTRTYDVVRLEALPDGFVQQHVLRADLPNGGTWTLDACVIVRVEDGLIVRLDEYLDSAQVAKLAEALA